MLFHRIGGIEQIKCALVAYVYRLSINHIQMLGDRGSTQICKRLWNGKVMLMTLSFDRNGIDYDEFGWIDHVQRYDYSDIPGQIKELSSF